MAEEDSTIEVDSGVTRYYFDIKESKSGGKFLRITDYNKRSKKRTEIIIWHDHVNKFSKAVQKAASQIQGIADHQCEAGPQGFCTEPSCGKFLH